MLFHNHPHEHSTETPQIRAVFMGTPEFSCSILEKLIEKHYNIVAVYTQPDRASGRKQEVQISPVKELALSKNIPVEQPTSFDTETIKGLKSYKPDVIIVAAYGRILPEAVLKIPGFGCVNVHPSMLPKFRGASPIQNALLQGERETGTSIMLMDAGMDTGDVLAQKVVPIDPKDTTLSLSARLAEESAHLLLDTLPLWIEREIEPKKQDSSQATLCQLIEREDGHIIWTDSAESIYNRFRALHPWPGIFTFWNKDGQVLRLKIYQISHQKQASQIPHHLGEVFEVGEKIGVQTSSGIVFLEEIQLEGKDRTTISEFIKGAPQFVGSLLQ